MNSTSQNGVTLAGLLIAIVVMGLIIGGVMRGTELNENTRMASTIRQVQSFDAATTNFRDKYGAWPGDIKDPAERLPNCKKMPCAQAGNDDGFIGISRTLAIKQYKPEEFSESRMFWYHLAATNKLSDMVANDGWTGGEFGVEFPKAAIGGGFTVSGYKVPAHKIYPDMAGNYLRLWAHNNPVFPVLNGRKAHLLDNKMDDGMPGTGFVIASGENCIVKDQYNDGNKEKSCIAFIKLQHD